MLTTPHIALTADDKPLSDVIMDRLISLSITDNKAGEADELTLTLSDHDNALALPRRGVVLSCQMGFMTHDGHTGMADMGRYVVDSIEWGGTPDVLTVKAKSADMKNSLKQARSISYHQKTLGQIAKEIADRHELTLAIDDNVGSIATGHIDQTDESDMHLLTRLCWQFGAVMTIKQGKLIIYRPYQNKSISGKELTLTTITRQTGDSFRFGIEDRSGDQDGVVATYYDKATATRQTVSTNPNAKNVKRLKGVYSSKEKALAHATAEKTRAKQTQATFSINLARGYPAITTESPIKLVGFKAQIDRLNWTVARATHSYGKSSGLTTSLELVASMG